MEDTLRYFFSAVFQGFAAVITLGIMFYLYYMDRINKKLEEIESSFSGFESSPGSDNDLYIKEHGLVSFVKEKLLPLKLNVPTYDNFRRLVAMYDDKINQKEKLKTKLLVLFKLAVSIILISLISLFCVGYYSWANTMLFISGLVCLFLSVLFFNRLFTFIKDVISKP